MCQIHISATKKIAADMTSIARSSSITQAAFRFRAASIPDINCAAKPWGRLWNWLLLAHNAHPCAYERAPHPCSADAADSRTCPKADKVSVNNNANSLKFALARSAIY